MKVPFFQINYQPTKRVQIDFSDAPAMTKQAPKDECDINRIMAKYEKDGLLDHLNTHQGDYGDFVDFNDYHSSLNAIHAAQNAFMSIPPAIRAKFNNDAAQFLEFTQDPKNLDQMVDLGLARRPVKASPDAEPPKPGVSPPENPLPAAADASSAA